MTQVNQAIAGLRSRRSVGHLGQLFEILRDASGSSPLVALGLLRWANSSATLWWWQETPSERQLVQNAAEEAARTVGRVLAERVNHDVLGHRDPVTPTGMEAQLEEVISSLLMVELREWPRGSAVSSWLSDTVCDRTVEAKRLAVLASNLRARVQVAKSTKGLSLDQLHQLVQAGARQCQCGLWPGAAAAKLL